MRGSDGLNQRVEIWHRKDDKGFSFKKKMVRDLHFFSPLHVCS
jgi:hypothetical protein